MSLDINQRATTALRRLKDAGLIQWDWPVNRMFSVSTQPGLTAWILVTGTGGGWFHGGGDRRIRASRCTIDLSNPVTAASLIVLVREAWGDPEWHCVPDNTHCGWWSQPDESEAPRLMYGSEVEACVAALEAKVLEVTRG